MAQAIPTAGSEQPAWEFADSFTSIHGKHTIGVGFDIRRLKLIRNLADDFYGDWRPSSSNLIDKNSLRLSQRPGFVNGATSLVGTGNAVADMAVPDIIGRVSGFVPCSVKTRPYGWQSADAYLQLLRTLRYRTTGR